MKEKDWMKKMAENYKSVKIPEELQGKVLDAIEEGKKQAQEGQTEQPAGAGQPEENNSHRSHKVRKIFMRTGQTAAAALLAITVLANSGAETAYAMERIPVIGAITKVVTFRTYEKSGGSTEAKIEVPKIETDNSGMQEAAEQVNQSAEEYTNRLIAQYEADVEAGGDDLHKSVYSGYEIVTDNDRLFTLKITTDEIMASAAESVKLYTIDKQADKILTLKNLFPAGTDYVKVLSDAVKQKMEEEMAADENKKYFLNDGMDSDFQSIDENQNFYINDAGHLVLVFDEYQVAPGYMGVVEIEIPEDVFQY